KSIGRSGLDFAKGKRDGMHIEISHGATQKDVNEAAKMWEDYVGRSSTSDIWWKNAKGEDVADFQAILRLKGFKITWTDGKAGDETIAAVLALQKAMNIKKDGRVGSMTRTALSLYKVPDPQPAPQPPVEPVKEIPNMDAHRIG